MRRCTRCGMEKPEEDFSWYNKGLGTRQYMCKECHKEMNQIRYQEKKEQIQKVNKESNARRVEEAQRFIYEFLSNSTCESCGEYDFAVLTFHHVRGIKKMNIMDMASRGYSLKAIQNEINKCIVLCASCHMRAENEKKGGRFKRFYPRLPWEKD